MVEERSIRRVYQQAQHLVVSALVESDRVLQMHTTRHLGKGECKFGYKDFIKGGTTETHPCLLR